MATIAQIVKNNKLQETESTTQRTPDYKVSINLCSKTFIIVILRM